MHTDSQMTNLVFMGMGEPFDNLDEVLKVLEILTSEYGYGWSPKRITVSSVGLKKGSPKPMKTRLVSFSLSGIE